MAEKHVPTEEDLRQAIAADHEVELVYQAINACVIQGVSVNLQAFIEYFLETNGYAWEGEELGYMRPDGTEFLKHLAKKTQRSHNFFKTLGDRPIYQFWDVVLEHEIPYIVDVYNYCMEFGNIDPIVFLDQVAADRGYSWDVLNSTYKAKQK
ncbi:MAG TPA: hypothetical protein VLH19_05225 [Patescibacteria group bacterium]|nr:hypothetical protein [Patescibacteria group bacterium]